MRQLAAPSSAACVCGTVLQHRVRLAWSRAHAVHALGPLVAARSCCSTRGASPPPSASAASASTSGRSADLHNGPLSHRSSILHRLYSSSGSGRMRGGGAARAGGAAGQQDESSGYKTLAKYVLYENEVKKSKFIVHAWPVSSASEALSLIRGASDPSATHNCFAYLVGQEHRCSDDGEPGGTAGRPILSAIEAEGLDRVAVLVIRHFGGIKLGAGGLVRAYGGAARECLQMAPTVFAKVQVQVLVNVTYDELGIVYGCLDKHGCERMGEEYGSSGTVTLRARVDADQLEGLKADVADGTAGRRRVQIAKPEATSDG